MNTLVKAGSLSILALSTILCQAQLLFEQLPLENHGGFRATDAGAPRLWIPADDFQLDTAASISRLQWWGGGLASGNETYFVQIFGDAANLPGQPLYQFNVESSSPSITPLFIHTASDTRMYSYSANLPTPFQAAANERYWVSIQNTGNTSWPWAYASGIVDNGRLAFRDRFGDWNPNMVWGNDLAFALHTVPEPTAATLLAAGASAILFVRRRRIG